MALKNWPQVLHHQRRLQFSLVRFGAVSTKPRYAAAVAAIVVVAVVLQLRWLPSHFFSTQL